jgi:D-amino-acid dehydrogenase
MHQPAAPRPPRLSPSPDVIVVGGGIVGTSAAAFLAGAGARVLLVERDGLASGASGANAGAIWHPLDPVLVGLYRASLPLYRELAATSNVFRIDERPAGLLELAETEAAVRAEADAVAEFYPELLPTVLDPLAVRAAAPGAADGLWGCLLDLGYPIAPASGTYAFASLAESRGAVIRAGRAATLALEGDVVRGVRVDGELVPCGAVIAAAGPWTPELLAPTGFVAPIRPLWGVVVEVEPSVPMRHIVEEINGDTAEATRVIASGRCGGEAVAPPAPGTPPESPSLEHAHCSLVPTPGVISAGSTTLASEPDPTAWIEPILLRASRFLPTLLDTPIRGVRCCPRPFSADGRPLIGRVPGMRGLVIAAGHGPWGISTGPESGRLAAELALGRSLAIPKELNPARFA